METLCRKDGRLLGQQPDMVRIVTFVCSFLFVCFTILMHVYLSSLCVPILTGIWGVRPQAEGDHGEKGSVCPQHDSSAAAIPKDQKF